MIKTAVEIAAAFSCFHDGTVSLFKGNEQNFTLKIECEYLAEIIDPKFDTFWIEIHDCDKLSFIPWRLPEDLPEEIWTDLLKIFSRDLEIINARYEDDFVRVFFQQHDSEIMYSGGELELSCGGVTIFDQSSKCVAISDLRKICTDYWNKFG